MVGKGLEKDGKGGEKEGKGRKRREEEGESRVHHSGALRNCAADPGFSNIGCVAQHFASPRYRVQIASKRVVDLTTSDKLCEVP